MVEIYCENCGALMYLSYEKGCYVCECCGNTTMTTSDIKKPEYVG